MKKSKPVVRKKHKCITVRTSKFEYLIVYNYFAGRKNRYDVYRHYMPITRAKLGTSNVLKVVGRELPLNFIKKHLVK